MTLRTQSGVTLIELLVSITAGVIVVFAVTNLMIGTLSGNTTNLRYTRMNQDLRSTLEAMSKDITRAGEWGAADDVVHAANTAELSLSGTSGTVVASAISPGTVNAADVFKFTNAANALTGQKLVVLLDNAGTRTRYDLDIAGRPSDSTLSLTIPSGVTLPSNKIFRGGWVILNPFAGVISTATCVIARYDLDNDGSPDDNEWFGFRLRESAIEASSTAQSCTDGDWERFTDPAFLTISAFNVTRLRETVTASNQITADLDYYLLDLTGSLVKEPAAVRNVQQAVKVRNNSYR